MKIHDVGFFISEELDKPSLPRLGPIQRTLASQQEHACNRKGPSPLISLDQACLEATRMAFRHRNKVTFSEILAVPVVSSNAVRSPVNKATKQMEALVDWACVQAALDAWAPSDVSLRPLRRCLDARDFSHWRQRDTQYLLEHTLPTGPTFHHKLTLPAESTQELDVRLRVLLIAASSPTGWPSRLLEQTQRDQRLKAILGSALAQHHSSTPLLVGTPQRPLEAIPCAVDSWLCAFQGTPRLMKLDVELDRDDDDRWWLHIDIPQSTDQFLRVPLRAHLLGNVGLRAILTFGERTSREYLQ